MNSPDLRTNSYSVSMIDRYLFRSGWTLMAVAAVLIVTAILWRKLFFPSSTCKLNLPRGPKPIPVLGNVNLLSGGEMPERLWQICGCGKWPIMSFKFPNRQSYVISSPEICREMLVTKGTCFNDRFTNTTSKIVMTRSLDGKVETGALFTPHGPTWKVTRKLIVQGQAESKRLHGDSFIVQLLEGLFRKIDSGAESICKNGEIQCNARNTICRSFLNEIFLHFCFGPGAQRFAEELYPLNDKLFACLDTGEFIDWFFPTFLGRIFNPIVNRFHSRKLMKRILDIFEELLAGRPAGTKGWALCELVKAAEESGEINHDQGLHVYHEVCFAGQEPTSSAMEGMLKELARHPEIVAKVQEEMDRVLGRGKQLRFQDVDQLPYLQAVIKECLRIHRGIPLLLAHYSTAEATLGGYDIPKGSSLFVNLWGISHDPKLYPDPRAVKPERFLNKDVNFTGQDGSYIIFGAGQRMCPGMNLALMIVHMVVGSLCQRYTFKLPSDWTEGTREKGTFFKAQPLRLCFTKREGLHFETVDNTSE